MRQFGHLPEAASKKFVINTYFHNRLRLKNNNRIEYLENLTIVNV